MKYKYFFTITPGRTGTSWLATFLEKNLAIESVHEPLGIDDFGVRMPDIKLMRTFNDRGNTALVKSFYRTKLDEISKKSSYAETNHTLAKCGFIENLATHPIAKETCVLILKRDFAKQCASHVLRGDFMSLTIDWQWYLSPLYRNIIINPKPFLPYEQIGRALWYVYEMDARQEYYKNLYSQSLDIIEVRLNQIVSPAGAQAFLKSIGVERKVQLPEKRNASAREPDQKLLGRVRDVIAKFNYSADEVVENYISSGKRLSLENISV